MSQYRITYGSVRDCPGVHRQGWWWHCYSRAPDEWIDGYAPEGPFLTKAHARRHLINTLRAINVDLRTFRWTRMPPNAGWSPRSGLKKKPTLKPLTGTRVFGWRLRAKNLLHQ